MAIQSRITNVAARIRDTLFGRTDQADKAWENEQREQAKAEARHPSANAHIERHADIQNDPTMQGYVDRGDSLDFGWGHFAESRERHAAAKTAREQSRDDDRDYGR